MAMFNRGSRINLLYMSIVALNLASVFSPTPKHQTYASGSVTTCRIWLNHGNAGNWHSSKNYVVVHYPDGTVLGEPNDTGCLMTYDNANHKWFLDVPLGGEYAQFFFDVNGNGYSPSDRKDIHTGLVSLPAVPCESCVLCNNQYRSEDPVEFQPFVAVPTDRSYDHVDHFEEIMSAYTNIGGGNVSMLCAYPGANIPGLLDYFNSLPTYEQDEFLESVVNVYPSPETMTGAEIIAYLTAYAAAHPDLVALQPINQNGDRDKTIATSIIILATMVTVGYFFISKRQRNVN
ncbi:MAG: hypothetical protein ACOX3K_04650 [Bacilli bacterium]